MRKSVKAALATSALAVAGGLFLVGSSFAERGAGPMGHMRMMGGLGHEMLQNVDTNNDGALSQEEIDAAINSRFSQFDADKDGSLSLREFEALWADITKPLAVRAFQFLDPNGDAAVAKTELDDRFGTVVSSFDRNDDGKLSPDDRRHHRGARGWWHGGERGEASEGGQPDAE